MIHRIVECHGLTSCVLRSNEVIIIFLIGVKTEQCIFPYISRLVILGFQKWSVRPLSLVVSGERFHGWPQNFWMVAAAWSLKRWENSFLFYLQYMHDWSILWFQRVHIELTNIFMLSSGWCVLLWDCSLGTPNRRRTLCRFALWCYYRWVQSSIADIQNAVCMLSNFYELELNVSCSFVCRWHCEQHSTAAGARLLWPRVEVTDGAMLVNRTIWAAKLHRDRK